MKLSNHIKPIISLEAKETMALLKILALGERQIEEGKVQEAFEVFRKLRAKHDQPR